MEQLIDLFDLTCVMNVGVGSKSWLGRLNYYAMLPLVY